MEKTSIQVYEAKHPGLHREQQEDACAATVLPDRAIALLVVSDGMGGHAGGEIASQAAVEAVTQALEPVLMALQPAATRKLPEESLVEAEATVKLDESASPPAGDFRTRLLPETADKVEEKERLALLEQTVGTAQRAVERAAAQHPDRAGDAGCTLTLGVIVGRDLYLAHLGDSRAYLWRQSRLRQLTNDHSGAAMLVAAGVLSAEDAREHPDSSRIYRFLGGGAQEATPDLTHVALEPEDLVILCSDGLWNMVLDTELAGLLIGAQDLPDLARQLIDTANANGGADNISVVLAQLG